jgi:hypothetical protein
MNLHDKAVAMAESLEDEAAMIAANSGIENSHRFVECIMSASVLRVAQAQSEALPQTETKGDASGN